jgi:hypothetical protein
MNLFKRLLESKFDEIQRRSNENEKNYLEIISNLKTEFTLFKEKAQKEITRLGNELRKQKQ